MACTIERSSAYEIHLRDLLKTYPRSRSTIESLISGLADQPEQGDVYPGFGPAQVRKVRIALPEYRLGQSSGVRLLYLFKPQSGKILLLAIYRKGAIKAEHEVIRLIKKALKEELGKN